MGKKEKIPAPGAKNDKFTNFWSKGKWKQFLAKAHLDIAGRNIQQRGSLIIGNALSKNKVVSSIDFSHNHMGDGGAVELAQILKVNEIIQRINLSHNEISDIGGIALASAFIPCANPTGQPSQWNRSVGYMNISCNHMGDDTLLAFSNAAACSRELTLVDLSWNQIGPQGAKALLRSMQRNAMCTFILAGNSLGDEGCKQVCEAWKRFGGPQNSKLNLQRNDISKDGAIEVGKLLENNEFVMDVHLGMNTIDRLGGSQLFRSMLLAKVRFLNLSHNVLGDDGAVEIGRVLIAANLEHLIRINLSNNNIGDIGGEEIAKGLLVNSNLMILNLSENKFGEKTVRVLGEVVRDQTKKMKHLDLRKSIRENKLRQELVKASNENSNLRVDMGSAEEDAFFNKVGEHMRKILEDEEKAKSKKKKGGGKKEDAA